MSGQLEVMRLSSRDNLLREGVEVEEKLLHIQYDVEHQFKC